MGGTTTDICLIKDGYPELDPTGAIVGGWSSSIEAIKFKTIGLGGDSQIVVNEEGKLEIGPKRVIPYSIAAKRDKVILEELKKMKNKDLRICEREFLVLNRFSESISYSKQERKLLKLLESGPKSLKQLVEELDLVSFDFLETKRLEQLEVIKRIGLTPTDILHVLKEYNDWNTEAAELGFRSLFKEIREGKENLANKIKEEVTRKSAREIITYLINREYKNYEEDKCKVCEELLKLSLSDFPQHFY
jgi:N-methylhydantoinase A/oxoprolinase/acetone carboxylase beta subunit